jgi:isopentenyl-diphosphate delta-isomerase
LNTTQNDVILVDEFDTEIGQMEKLEAHQKGVLHRAFSVLIFNDKKEMLLQQRAYGKYHSEGLWTNACCSHQAPNESNFEAAKRRLMEEIGMECTLKKGFTFRYKTNLENNLIENEFDHVILGFSNENPILNPTEAIDYKWISILDLLDDMHKKPEKYTDWFKLILLDHYDQLTQSLNL